jgi:hypothetical protein
VSYLTSSLRRGIVLPDPMKTRQADVLALFLGEYLGSGVAREVYAYRPAPEEWVVKIETGEGDFQNMAEWDMFRMADWKLKKHLAPCGAISPGGVALMQRRCYPCPDHMLPVRLPAILTDVHRGNFGLFEGVPVLVDYGRHLHAANTPLASKMLKVYYDKFASSDAAPPAFTRG